MTKCPTCGDGIVSEIVEAQRKEIADLRAMARENVRLRAERDRLAEALEKIAFSDGDGDPVMRQDEMFYLAHTTLEGT